MLTLEQVKNAHVLRVLEACEWKKVQAAKVLGINRRTLYRYLDTIEHERKFGNQAPT